MAFFSAFTLIDKKNEYKHKTMEICYNRKKLLFNSLGLEMDNNPNDACYYTQFDLLQWATKHHGVKFANYLKENYKPVDILYDLAQDSSIVLLVMSPIEIIFIDFNLFMFPSPIKVIKFLTVEELAKVI